MSQEATPLQREVRKFPLEGTNLHKILSDLQHRKAFHDQLKMYNPLVVLLYRIGLLPLFGASRSVMLLTTRGRKSGKLRSAPIGYFRIVWFLYLFSTWEGVPTYRPIQQDHSDLISYWIGPFMTFG